jgi:hypothetical protein
MVVVDVIRFIVECSIAEFGDNTSVLAVVFTWAVRIEQSDADRFSVETRMPSENPTNPTKLRSAKMR